MMSISLRKNLVLVARAQLNLNYKFPDIQKYLYKIVYILKAIMCRNSMSKSFKLE